jgi:hypothetical protein
VRFGWSATGANPQPEPARSAPPPPSEEPYAPGGARRPRSWWQKLSPRGGFSDEQIRWLEAHRGPLRRPPDES